MYEEQAAFSIIIAVYLILEQIFGFACDGTTDARILRKWSRSKLALLNDPKLFNSKRTRIRRSRALLIGSIQVLREIITNDLGDLSTEDKQAIKHVRCTYSIHEDEETYFD